MAKVTVLSRSADTQKPAGLCSNFQENINSETRRQSGLLPGSLEIRVLEFDWGFWNCGLHL
jgi:hypothetical protein